MRILQVNAVWQYGSTGRTCVEMSEYLWNHGHECFSAFSKGSETKYGRRIASTIECKLHALLSRISGLQGYYSPMSTVRLIRYIKEIHPDVVILRNLHANYINQNQLFDF